MRRWRGVPGRRSLAVGAVVLTGALTAGVNAGLMAGQALATPAAQPSGLTVVVTNPVAAPQSTVIADTVNNRVVAVSPTGTQTVIDATGLNAPGGVATDKAGDVFIANSHDDQVLKVTPGGKVTTVGTGLSDPYSVAVDSAGDVFIADTVHGRIVEVFPSGTQITLPFTGLSAPHGVAVDAAGDVYVADKGNNRVVELPVNGTQRTVGSDLNLPWGVALDAAGDLYIADKGNDRVVEVTPAGTQTTVGSGFDGTTAVSVDAAGDVFVADPGHGRVVEVAASGSAHTVGTGLAGPLGVAVGPPSGTPAAVGSPVTLTASALPSGSGDPTGTVTFTDGSLALGTATLSTSASGVDQATLVTSLLPTGTDNVTATYSGDGTYGGSSATTKVHVTVQPPVNTWPKIGHDPGNSGVSPDPLLSTADAAGLGVRWMADTGASALSSPVVAYNTTLQRTLVYQGNEDGWFTAFDEATGAVVWSVNLGSAIRDTPLVDGNNVWVSATFDPSLVKLNAATGATECSTPLVSTDNGSATIATPPGGSPTVYIGVNDLGTESGPVYAVNEANCAVNFEFTDFNSVAGSWDPLSYGVDSNGDGLILLGTADPDNTVYAFNALTGAKVWSFTTDVTGKDTDVGAGVSVTAPGVNGFADGVAYVPGKNGYMYALDLTTGALIWKFNFDADSGGAANESKSTPAVVGNQVIFGETDGVYCLNATTGVVDWRWNDGSGEALSAPAVVGPPGQQVVSVATLSGTIDVLSVSGGSLLYSYNAGAFSTSSVADVDGNLLASDSNGFLYDLAPGGGNAAAPSTAITSPANDSTVAYPSTDAVTVTGTASGAPASAVEVAVESGGDGGPWWDAATATWTAGFYDNTVPVALAGSSSTTWSLNLPVPAQGGVYRVLASAVGTDGVATTSALGATASAFSVAFSHKSAHISMSTGAIVPPGGPVTVSGTGFGAGEQVAFSLRGTVLATQTASSTGAVAKTTMTIPTSATFGPVSLVATGATTKRVSSVALDISNAWAQAGHDPLHSGFEPNDPVMAQHVSPSQGQYFALAWSYPSGAAINGGVAVSKNVAYFGNSAGTVTALNVHNSQPAWTADVGSTVDDTPAVDGGRVIVGTATGVEALDIATGAVSWTTPTSSAVESSPAVAGGVVYVGSDDGTVYALNETTGSVIWHVTMGGAVAGSPAVDTAAKRVVVGDSGGSVTSLSTADGSTQWSVPTGGAVSATATIAGGDVFVGSANDRVQALNEGTGAVVWTQTTGGPVTAGGALYTTLTAKLGSTYVVGDGAGDVYYLNTRNGNITRTVTESGSVVGVSVAAAFVTVTTSAGIAAGIKPGNVAWVYHSTSPFGGAAALVNGVVYVGGEDFTLSAFTIPGQAIP